MTDSTCKTTIDSTTDRRTEKTSSVRCAVRRLPRLVGVYVLVPYLAVTLLFTLVQRRILYHATPSPPLAVAATGLPAGAAEDVTITSEDGLTLHGWLLKSERIEHSTETSAPKSPLVLYFPGNAQHRFGRLNDLQDFTALGCDVLIFDYRGYAENDGSPNETAIASDALAIWDYAVKSLRVEPERLFLFGESLGGAVAVRLAQTLCERQTPPAGLITNATFASVPRLAARHYPLFPFRWLVLDRWPSVERIGEVTCPLLMFHGSADEIVPIDEGRRLFTAAPDCSHDGCRKTFVEIHGAGHNDVPIRRLQEHVARLLSVVR